MSIDINAKILAAFQAEHKEHLEGIRTLLAAVEHAGDGEKSKCLDEAFRMAHSLKGGRVCDLRPVESLAHRLETVFEQVRSGDRSLDENVVRTVGVVLDTIEDWMAGLDCDDRSVDPAEALAAIERLLESVAVDADSVPAANAGDDAARQPVRPPTSDLRPPTSDLRPPAPVETVRISTESLDRVLRSSGQLLAQSLYQEQMGRELEAVRRQIGEMDREREAVRRVTAANLHRLTAVPEFNHLVRSLDSIDRGIHWLSARARRLCRDHKRHSLTLESCGRQLQRDVRHARMVTAESVFPGLRKTVRDLAREEGKQVELALEGFDVRADRMVFQALKDPLFHMLRNCISHGIEAPDERAAAGKGAVCRVGLRMETTGNRLVIDVEDDGRGLDTRRIAARAVDKGLASGTELAEWTAEEIESLIFQPGFSTSETVTEIAGRGMGLSVVQEAAGRLQGDVAVHRNETGGTRFRLSVPLSVSTHRLLLVSAGEGTFALPVLAVDRLLRVKVDDLETIEGKPVITFRDQPVPLVSLAHVLGQNGEALTSTGKVLHVAVLKSGVRRLAVSVDDFLAERELLIQDLDEFAARKEYFGAVLLNDGGVALVLNPTELLKRSRPAAQPLIVADAEPRVEKRSPRVLVVDDSFTTRTLEKSILEANGYEVAIAVDGVEGLSQLKCEPFDLVISDIEMPRMDGFSLLEAIKQDARLSSTPVILVTSRDRPEDRERGLDLGADAYIVKQRFDHQSLLETIRQIVE